MQDSFSHRSTGQVKSKQRVTDHGEVFTSEREVNAMLDLVKQETERIDSRFLEPACGNGNFLIEITKYPLTFNLPFYSPTDSNNFFTPSFLLSSNHKDENVGLYDTTLSRTDYEKIYVNEG